MFHLHRLQPQHRLAPYDGVALADRDPYHRAGHGREERAGRDLLGRVGQRGHGRERDGPGGGVDVDVPVVRGDREPHAYAVACQHDLLRAQPGQFDAREALGGQAVAGEPVGHLGLLVHDAARLGGDVAPAGRQVAQRLRGGAVACGAGERGGQRQQAYGVLVREGRGGVVAVEEAGVGRAAEELRVPQHVDELVAVGDRAVQARAGERGGQPAGGGRARRGVHDQLGQHRVVVRGDHAAGLDPGVQPQPVRRRRAELRVHSGDAEAVQRAAVRAVPLRRVLGVQARLDRVAGRPRRVVQPAALGDRELQRHEVDAVHALGDRVLDLKPGVHLKEEETAVGGEQELHGARTRVADGARGRGGRLAQALPQLGVDRRRGRLLDHLLVAALDGALPLPQRPHRTVGVGEDLHLDVAGAGQERLAEHRRVAERRLGLAPRRLQGRGQLPRVSDDPHAAATAAGRRLDEHGIRDLRLGVARVEVGQHGHAGLAHEPLGLGLEPHRRDRPRGRADPGEAGLADARGEAGVLRQEAVAGVDRVGARRLGRGDDRVLVEVRRGGCRARQAYGEVGLPRVRHPFVGVGVHRDGLDAEVAAGTEDAPGDLAPVGHQQSGDHSPTSGRRRSRPRTGRARGRC